MGLTPEIERCKAKLQREPQSLVFAQLADAYRKSGMLDEAIRVCREGLKHHPNYASAYMVLGRTYLAKGELPEAREAFQQTLHLSPDNVLAYRFLGQIAEAQGEIEEAAHAYRTALTLNPFDQETRAALGGLEAKIPAPEQPTLLESPASASEAPSSEPSFLVTEILGDLYASQGFLDQALETYKELMAATPDREDLQKKYQDLLTRLRPEGPSSPPPVATRDRSHEIIERLEAWRQAFQGLRMKRGGGG